nr:acetyltransferase [Vibrio mimicus]
MVTVVVFEFGVMRCQPLRRALGNLRKAELEIKYLK